ncbi:Cytochrome c oxidase subunit 6B [Coemansia sp. RSA 455]|uniref:Cytochrome c oxidase subunit n=2 Tax=Coemansia TaxID=4863 RepID=A0A9W8LAZ3_9FUNG|nr:Cytochrome c oxidase subunit 6B [Coemansia sp. S17]KAJ2019028.1 Cytochrome c oxidase subunit 6B [Coemansia sp. S680]KAJ2038192.1 Cytochrome c oxidase subunit 6B [Coemansia sp. S3946]KAJ2046050.1 Cytochrome c oxidase subunit 6B [Coemansia sp. S16]KAJ2067071.1 Cytochrome c oxidase subunit 6B [Coemansia sp. S155-1]KAJ2078765.1 Cytochrome c oxidase subunit 6B [Coemansia sp. S100]KAJ2114659.1 Cytochrome c oxidase subunit 6B [Coemansia sp. RSA 922]KAJ2245621.1 Cytochrome c oxidase subunit 6B [C
MSDILQISTEKFDARFPNVNQTKRCWQNYFDYTKCVAAKGEDYAPCKQFLKAYTTLCPNEWIERWDAQKDDGTLPIDTSS